MCEECNEEQKLVHEMCEKWMKQQNFEANTLTEVAVATGFRRLPTGILVVQQLSEAKKIDSEGVTDLPDGPVSGIYLHEDAVDDFMNELLFAMGPVYFAKMVMRTLRKVTEEDDDNSGK